jgi:membrane protease YdiL (CAAX protease family)
MDMLPDSDRLFLSFLLGNGVVLLLVWAVARWRRIDPFHRFPYHPRCAWLVVAFPLLLIAQSIASRYSPIPADPTMDALLTGWPVWQLVVAIVLVAPLVEEYIFRGVALVWLRRYFNEMGTAILTATGWAALHGQYDLFWMAAIGAIGILLAYLRMAGASLGFVIALHAANNAIALTLYRAL